MEFIKLKEEHLEIVYKWRRAPHVTQFMYSDISEDYNKHLQWYQTTLNDSHNKYWMIKSKDSLIGLISLNRMDTVHRHATFGYYIGDTNFNIIGGRIHPYLYNYAFNTLGLHKLFAEVMEGNTNMCKMHTIYGFREVGVYKEHIYKYEKYHDVTIFELLAEDWKKNHKYQRYVAEFEK
ncbi:UDP-4-amino-4,6-dideoxy-N-acetyl-beta-L-altrosamine N-acetyltransferase [Desulfuribacillus stibiiarsenatis]|uniref:UDP-4-amino-4, 6-dideoxy-N-acetyl-beta-L-altrosamine N-acetyltransferase n=1 Tax=Desulfuribacillus stibiiarsenatis TaxID=1390249 RepID=A0A1E5L9V6_9FIRM|nr:UDP-4-amino-4,6-dideoxy-N-acetyl-beta-L-altrosamine N-acetyltransferase [Desulfuribacillus stibiiarsenatis]OEH86753.1 UDP-4-amino-4,6-dideoxy-N-acetyl-beta-L-altrosamine N-acetyltransferase [Desulfuribacillus stibiiarsenatis]